MGSYAATEQRVVQPRGEFREAAPPGAVRLHAREQRIEKGGGQRRLAEQQNALEHFRSLEGARDEGDSNEELRLGCSALSAERLQQTAVEEHRQRRKPPRQGRC